MPKIYVIGIVGSGKSTFARKLSKELKIEYYELDNIVWKYNPGGDIKRSDEEIDKIFNEVINKDNWIIEDVGRDVFQKGIEVADTVIYLNVSASVLKRRILIRWVKQRIGIEKSSYKPTVKMLKNMTKWCLKDLKRRDQTIMNLEKQSKELILLNEKTMNNFKI